MELIVIAALVAVAVYLYRHRGSGTKPSNARPASSDASSPDRITIRLTIGTSSDADTNAATSQDCWVPPGRTTTIAGRTIPGGMVYVGSGLHAVSGFRIEPALIDPALPVDSSNPDRDGSRFSYWPSYETIPPGSRAAYLDWLADGRCAPDAPIGYVFLFFYGLERRLLADARELDQGRSDAAAIIAEVRRLLSLHGSNGSFRSYATGLLGVATALFGTTDDLPIELASGYSADVPAAIRVALARLARSRAAVPAELAFALYAMHPGTRSPTALRRCHDECRALFAHRYRHRFNDGIVIEPTRTRLELAYCPASSGFAGRITRTVADLHEADVLARVPAGIREVGDSCVADLEAYSRFVGKRADERGSLPALALLPAELLATISSTSLEAMRAWVSRRADSGVPVAVPGSELLDLWPSTRGDRLPKADAVALSQLLEKLGYGLEPDVRLGGPALTRDKPVVLYRLPSAGMVAPSPAYAAGCALLNLAVAVAGAHGGVTEAEEEHLEQHLERGLGLDEAEVHRLRAHLRWLIAAAPGLTGVKKKLEGVPEEMRERIAAFLVSVAGADGRLEASEVRMLQRVYRLLGRNEDDVFAALHDLEEPGARADNEPVVVRPAGVEERGIAIPPPPAVPPPEIRLDMDRVKAKLAETATVSALLAGVFSGDDEEKSGPPVVAAGAAQPLETRELEPVAGLDARHSQLLRLVAKDSRLTRESFEDLASALGLLPEGALDVLNERALELHGEPLLDGDDELTINHQALETMLA